jgi:predicted DCC family thiol-disulfide oxidoreductase YuxK
MDASKITVIYDGECRFCKASVDWLSLKLDYFALPFQSLDFESFGLTREECLREVVAIDNGVIYRGAGAVTYLLGMRGNRMASWIVRESGGFGRRGYKWVAGHRNSFMVKVATKVLEKLSAR